MKDLKVLLKEARQAIKLKEYDKALQHSKAILKQDKCNYMALIFLGVALQEVGPTDQAIKAFRKAEQLEPLNPLAWNGIISYYERLNNDESKIELIPAYIKLLELESSDNKVNEFLDKLVELLQGAMDLPDGLNHKVEECLIRFINDGKHRKLDYYLVYLSMLYKQGRYEDLVHHAEKAHKFFEKDTVSLSWVCKIFNQLYVEQSELADKFIVSAETCSEKLLEMELKDAMAMFTKSIFFLRNHKVIEAKEGLEHVTKVRPGLLHAWVLLTKVYASLWLIEQALQALRSSEKLLTSMKSSNRRLKSIVESLRIEIYAKSNNEDHWKKALELYNQENDEEVETQQIEYAVLVNLNLRNFADARKLISSLEYADPYLAKLLLAMCLHKEGSIDAALSLLQQEHPKTSKAWLELALLYLEKKEYKKCLPAFLKAATLDPNNYIIFMNLGDYYQTVNELDKARRCYEKAFKINPKSEMIITELSKMYRQQKNWVASQNLLQSLTTQTINRQNSWIWMQLGLSYLQQEDYNSAIDKLRLVLRVDENSGHAWQSLADAYFATGSYTSALKCYEKSLESLDDKLYSNIQIANINKLLGNYVEARQVFEEILLDSGQYIPALKGLSETCIAQAHVCYKDQRLGMARDHIQAAVNHLTVAIQQRSEFSCMWKLLADCCLFVAKFPEKHACIFIAGSLVDSKEASNKRMVEKEELFRCSTRFYCKAISLTEDNILIWHDLGISYLAHALQATDETVKHTLLNYAMAVAQHCTSNDPNSSRHWNLMGNISIQQDPPNYAYAQHAFIKAVMADQSSFISWTNLGVLYLLKGDIRLANKAFAQGQRSDPEYVNCWIGQALVAESMGNEEAMDLFRHSTILGQHQQGGLGYAHWVCQTLQDAQPGVTIYSIDNMHAVSVACDAITYYLEKNPFDACAWNMLGILREREGLKSSTLEAFNRAYRLCGKGFRDKARINCGRSMAKLEKYSQAIAMFQNVQEATFTSGSGLALALFKDKQYEDSYSAYEQALNWLTEEQVNQSELLVAMASMAYMFQDAESAKTLLFQSIQLKPPSPWALYATLSLGLLHDDARLSKLVLKELHALRRQKECLAHYATLLLYYYILQDEIDKAVIEVSKLIMMHPDSSSLWFTLSSVLLQLKDRKKSYLMSANCAHVAVVFNRSNKNLSKILGLVALSSFLAGRSKDAIISAQKAVFSCPNGADGYAVLCASLLKEKREHFPISKVNAMLDLVQSLDTTDVIKNWARKMIS